MSAYDPKRTFAGWTPKLVSIIKIRKKAPMELKALEELERVAAVRLAGLAAQSDLLPQIQILPNPLAKPGSLSGVRPGVYLPKPCTHDPPRTTPRLALG